MAESIVPQVYVDLSLQLVNELISPNNFMVRFLEEFKAEKRFFDERTAEVLNALFYAAEEFVDHPSSRSSAVDEVQLRAAAGDLIQLVMEQKQ